MDPRRQFFVRLRLRDQAQMQFVLLRGKVTRQKLRHALRATVAQMGNQQENLRA